MRPESFIIVWLAMAGKISTREAESAGPGGRRAQAARYLEKY